MRQNPNTLIVKVDAGSIDRKNDLIRFPFNPKDHFPDWQEGVSTLAITQTDADGSPLDTETPAQFEPTIRELAWQTGTLGAGESAWYAIRVVDLPPTNRYAIEQKPAHLLIAVDNQVFTRYNFLGVWKPYFWPLNGNYGTVVRGAGGGDHPHHTGLYLAYGGHGEGGSANIWSDWDEPPYGPCGKMLHQRFIRLTAGPVYAEFVEDLIYVKGNGDQILTETRTARAWYADNGRRFLGYYPRNHTTARHWGQAISLRSTAESIHEPTRRRACRKFGGTNRSAGGTSSAGTLVRSRRGGRRWREWARAV